MREEAADDGSCDRADECGASKQAQCEPSIDRAPKVRQRTADDGQGCRAEHSSEESADHDCVDILRDRNGDLEDGKDGEAEEEGFLSAVKLGEWTPDNGS